MFSLTDFPTFYNRAAAPVSESGCGVRPVFSSRFDDCGVLVVEQTGKDDLYASIQSHADSCCVDTIIRRYNSGDMTALSQRQGLFLDTTAYPASFADLLNIVRDHQLAFEALPADLRSKFGNNFAAWASAAGTTDWLNTLNEYAAQHAAATDGGDTSES